MSKISELTDGGSLLPTDFLIAVRSGANVKVQADQADFDRIRLGDNEKIELGNSQDLTLVHTATQSIINQAGIGDLLLQKAGATKLTINASGIDVTGTVTADGLVSSGDSTIGGSSATSNVLLDLVEPTSSSDIILGVSANGSGRTQIRSTQGLGTSSDFRLLTVDSGNTRERLKIDTNGDISFYEDTGSTAKLTWSASNESLTFGTNLAITTNEIDVASGNLTLDVAGRIILDADTDGDIRLQDGGSFYGQFFESGDNFYIRSRISDKDIIFNGNYNGNFIDALTLDMSNAGAATFNAGMTVGGNVTIQKDDALIFMKETDGTNIAAVGDLTGAGQGGAFYYNHGGTAVIQLKSYEASQINSGIVFNEDSANVDFRVESDSNANMLFVDASTNRVGVGTSGPLEILHGHNGSGDDGTYLRLSGGGSLNESYGGWMRGYGVSGNGGFLELGVVDAGTKKTAMQVTAQGNNLKFYTAAVERLQFDYLGNTVFNESGTNSDFRVESDNSSYGLYVDASQDSVGILTNATDAALNVNSQSGTKDAIRIVGSGGNNFIAGYGNQGNLSFTLQEGEADDASTLILYRLGNAQHLIDADSNETVIFNEQGDNIDFRVESDGNTHAVFVDASTNRVGILNNNPAYAFHVDAEIASSGYYRVDSSSSYNGTALLTLKRNGNTTGDYIQMRDGSNNLFASFDEGGIIFNEIGGDTDFRVESDTISSAFFVDGATGISSFGQQVKCWLATAGQYTFTSQNSAGSTGMYLLNSNNQWSTTYNGGASTGDTVMTVGKDGTTSRSINAGGTINASGSDYAEYMVKANDFTAAKGSILGIDATGKLTDVYSDAISFCVKTTDPSYVGGDTWSVFAGEKPAYDSPDYAAWESAYEAARATVDRIAFSGQVPVNITGATSGQYIIPINNNGSISGEAVTSPTFEQYKKAVGKVIAIEADGRARILVKII